MAITGEQLVTDALYGAQILGVDQQGPTDNEAQTMLRRLNRMLDSWANEGLMVYAITSESFAMTAGQAAYSSSLLASRPVAIDSIFVRLTDIDYPVQLVDNQYFDAIPYKATTGIPGACYVDTAFPNMTFNFYPAPYAAFTCFINSRKTFQAAIALATSVTLPPGYEKALVDGLTVEACRTFGREPTADMVRNVIEAKAVLKRTNYKPLVAELGFVDQRPSPDAFIYKGF